MTRSIPCEPVSPFTNPTSLSISVNTALATTAKYIVRLTATTGSLALTVPAGRSHLIQNEGAYMVNIGTTGNATVTLPAGQELRATWDQSQNKHEVQLAASSGSIDNAMSAVSTNAVQNAVIKAYVDSNAGATVATNLAALRALAATPSPVVVKGHTTAWDGGGGVFDLLASSGGTVGDTGSGGHDDNGWHIVCTSTGAVYGRRDTVVTPQQFGAVGVETDAQAAAAADSYAALQRAVTFQLRPDTFPGWTTYRSIRQPLEFIAPHGYYRSESTIEVTLDNVGSMVDPGQGPGRIEWIGRVWTPRGSNIRAFVLNAERPVMKPQATFRAKKQRAVDGKAVWNADNWPDLWRDAAAYPAWAATTVFYAGEEITQVLGSGATALYCVTVSGTSGGSAPTHTTGTAANGGTTLEYLGTIKNTSGKSCWELARDCRDIGFHINSALNWQTLEIETDGYTIHVAEVPRDTTSSQIGFVKHRGNAYGCKFGMLVASYLYDHLVANQAARLALTGIPIGGVVRQSDDATNDYRFAGPLGTESTNGNWTVHTANPADNWTNENYADASLWYGRGDGTYIATTKSCYAVVLTKFNTASSIPTQNIVEGISAEFADMTGGELVQALVDYGAENRFSSRNDQESIGRAIVTVKHADTSKEPMRNEMRVARAGRWIASAVWSKDESCGRQNRVIQTPGRHEFVKEFACNSLFEDAVFSSYNRVYWQRVSIWKNSLTKPDAWSLYKYVYNQTSYTKFNPLDRSFNFSVHECPSVIVDIPDNHRGDAIIEVEVMQATISETPRISFSIFDPITGQIGNFSSRPRMPISGNITLSHTTISPSLPVLQSGLTSVVGQFSPEPWIKCVVARICGDNVVGFRVRLLEAKNGSVWSPGAAYRKIGMPWVAAKPERGIYRAPCRLLFEDQTGANKGCFLNKAPGETDYWATSGTTGSIGAPAHYQLGHDGAGTVKEWDGAAWQTVASGVTTLDPVDWVTFT